jgi:hypothetical protein
MRALETMGVALALPTRASLAFADPPQPPGREGGAIEVPATVAKDLVSELHLGPFVARFEETVIQEIAEELGVTSLRASHVTSN